MKPHNYMMLLRFLLIMALTYNVSMAATPSPNDTIWVDSVSARAGGRVALPVYFSNIKPLNAVEIVLAFDSSGLSLDSFTLDGGRLQYIYDKDTTIYFRDSGNMIDLCVQDFYTYIPSGSGVLCSLYFKINPLASGNHYIIDSGFYPPVSQTTMSDSVATTIFPQFGRGYITVLDAPPSPDSIWVDTLSTNPGESIALNVNGYNEEQLSGIRLALKYSSDSLEYDTSIFDGTRSEIATKRTISIDRINREILLSLNFSSANPLQKGSGSLAIIKFNAVPFGW